MRNIDSDGLIETNQYPDIGRSTGRIKNLFRDDRGNPLPAGQLSLRPDLGHLMYDPRVRRGPVSVRVVVIFAFLKIRELFLFANTELFIAASKNQCAYRSSVVYKSSS